MSASVVILALYFLLAIMVVTFTVRTIRIAKYPVHLRWELSPVPHEKGRGAWGGSYLEEFEWWKKPREKSLTNELIYMFKEIVFLKALWEHNRKMWYFSFPFHFGLYILFVMAVLVVLGGLSGLLNLPQPGVGLLKTATPILAGAGYILGGIGALGLFAGRLFSQKLKPVTSPASFINLALLLTFFISGVYAITAVPDFPHEMAVVLQSLVTVNLSGGIAAPLAIHLIVAGVFLAYLPFTQMMHFVAKYFTYHEVRWDDKPLEVGGKMEAEIQELLQQTVTWAAPHIGADGKKNWVDIATASPSEETE
ncbi:respiratory nitrate reductase subunit gamma [Gemmatimonadota bacterium]